MDSKKVQLYLDREKTIEASPVTGANCVILSDGNDLQKVLDNDLTNPTVVHEETSFKVGVGDINVSSSVVDGEVGRMVIKGQTYQNILPEPSLRNTMTDGKTVQKINEGYENVEVVDGVSKSAILSGNTLVNLHKLENYSVFGVVLDGGINQHFGNNTSYATWRMFDISMLKPNTEYGVFCWVLENTISENYWDGHVHHASDAVFNPSTELRFSAGETGLKFAKLTTISDFTGKTCGIRHLININTPSSEYVKFRCVIVEYQEGMENWDIPYFEGMQSVKMPVLKTTGKNLWSGENITIGKYVDAQGALVAANTDFLSEFIKVKPNTTYAFKVMDSRATTPYGVKSLYDKNKKFISRGNGVHSNNVPFTTPSNCHYVRIHGNSYTQCGNTIPDCMLIETTSNPSTIATHEPYKTNILSTPKEVVLRSLPNGVKDTLNLNTGEYVGRIGEVVFNGSENWVLNTALTNANGYYTFQHLPPNGLSGTNRFEEGVICDKFSRTHDTKLINAMDKEYCCYHGWSRGIGICINGDKLSTRDANGFKQWLSNNPTTVLYQLATPIIKTVDLSSSGNWEKVVLDGSESITMVQSNRLFQIRKTVVGIPVSNQTGDNPYILTETPSFNTWGLDTYNNYNSSKANSICYHRETFFIQLEKEGSVEEMTSRLQQKPLVIWYQIRTHQDSTQVKQPIFFKDGHIQLSSGADNSLIPTLDYQAKTSNSYVMDLMKTNTRYTMKAKSASGTFTIDGTSYGAGTNGTFTSPTSMTNKLLVMSNKTNEEVMILEGDVVSKTIPYFKGIKSAFEDESKIEVLSTGKNLFDGRVTDGFYNNANFIVAGDTKVFKSVKLFCKAGRYVMSFSKKVNIVRLLKENTYSIVSETNINTYSFTVNKDSYCGISFRDATSITTVWDDNTLIQIEETQSPTTYQPYKSNSTKIPLLSPLRSLPNGVCDELIIDRMKKKATLIQRIDKIVFDGRQRWLLWNNNPADVVSGYVYYDANNMGYQPKSFGYTINDRLPHNSGGHIATVEGARYTNYFTASLHKNRLGVISVNDTTTNSHMVQRWYTENPMTMYYELETPVVTEIDLENFPLVYKDGHIFLNSEIAPVVEIDYNVNQAQQIQANNETLQRHELDILDLDNLIVSFVNAEYNLRLLKFDMELSMMALAE